MKFLDELIKKLREPILKLLVGVVCALILILIPVAVIMCLAFVAGRSDYGSMFVYSFATSNLCLAMYAYLWSRRPSNKT